MLRKQGHTTEAQGNPGVPVLRSLPIASEQTLIH